MYYTEIPKTLVKVETDKDGKLQPKYIEINGKLYELTPKK